MPNPFYFSTKISSAIADNKVLFSSAITEILINKVIITTDMDSLINAIRSLNPWWANKPFQREGMIENYAFCHFLTGYVFTISTLCKH